MTENETAVLQSILEESRVIVMGHQNPDGDCLGVMSAIWQIRTGRNLPTVLISRDTVPSHLLFLEGMTDVQFTASYDCEGADAILLECGSPERSGIDLINPGRLINIDHHPDNQAYGAVCFLDPGASSIGEMITLLLHSWEDMEWTPGIADALYAAIHTDTGGFSYNNTRSEALEAAATLSRSGARIGEVCTRIYQEQPLRRLRLMGRYLAGLYTHLDDRFGIGVVRLKDLKACGCTPADTDNFSSFPRNMSGVEVGIYLLEKPDGRYKVSLRSKGRLPVNKAAARFGGGGHANAAGCVMEGDPDSIVAQLVHHLKQHECQ